ncbi:MAG: QueT transporter family protein [Oscillospiraceae bacterium]
MSLNKANKTRKMTKIAMIAGIYAAITFATFFMSFGQIQYRVSEVLTILPVFTVTAIPGLTLGCALANLVGFFIGVNPLGLMDAIFGTAASLIAAIMTYYLGKVDNKWIIYLLCPLPPVLINALVIGFELTLMFNPLEIHFFLLNALSVFIGQAVVCYGLGIPLMIALKKNDLYKKIFS